MYRTVHTGLATSRVFPPSCSTCTCMCLDIAHVYTVYGTGVHWGMGVTDGSG